MTFFVVPDGRCCKSLAIFDCATAIPAVSSKNENAARRLRIARYGRFINLASYYLVLEEVTMEEQEDSQPSTRPSCSGHKATFHMHCKRRDIMSHLGGTWDNLPVSGSERRTTIRKTLG